MKNTCKTISSCCSDITLIILLLLTSIPIQAQDQFLVVNPEGHKDQVRSLVISNDGKHLITGSSDKTVKKWDIQSGQVIKEYYGKIGKGIEGSIYNIALSPDNKYLAVQGWFGADDESESIGDVRLYDYETGKMVHVFHDLQSTPVGLGFTNDSRFLIAGDDGSNILKWDLESKKIVGSFKYHSPEFGKELQVIRVKDDIMVSVDRLGIMCVWDIHKPSKPKTVDKENLVTVVNNNYFAVPAIDIAPTTHEICFTWEEFVFFVNDKLKLTGYFQNQKPAGFVRYSPNGNHLITGVIASGTEQTSYVFTKNKEKKWVEAAAIPNTRSILCGAFLDDHRFVYYGGDHNELTFFKLDFDKNELNDYKVLKSNGANFNGAGLNGKTVAFSDQWTANFGFSKHNKYFDLFLKVITSEPNDLEFNYPDTTYEDYLIRRCRIGKKLNDYNKGLEICKKGVPTDTIVQYEWEGGRHTAFTFDPKGNIISGGNNGVLKAYDQQGNILNQFIGHTGYISGISISRQGDRIITSGSDNTIRIWSMEKVGVPNPTTPPESVWEYWERMDRGNGEDSKNNVFLKLYKSWGVENLAKQRTIEGWNGILKKTREKGFPYTSVEQKYHEYKAQTIYPIVTIFISTDGEWIIYNEQGYFSASKKGAKYVGYHLNQGLDKEARFYPFEQFDLKYNRPDIILKDLALGDSKIIEFYHQAYLKRLRKMHITEAELTSEIHLPELQILNHTLSEDKKSVELTLSASDTRFNLDRINVFLNDVPIYGSSGISLKDNGKKTVTQTVSFELVPGANQIKTSVLNEAGTESLSESIALYTPKTSEKPNLYLITIGTSHYSDNRFDLKYAAKDAVDIDHLFEKVDVYQNIYHKVLLDENATKQNILNLRSFLEKAGRNDVVMLFIAGHGLLDEKFDYYYATYDIDFNNPSENGIVYSEIEKLLDGLKALKKLLFMDTCHSGEVDKEDVEKDKTKEVLKEDVTFRASGINVKLKNTDRMQNASEMVKELFVDLRKGTGATVISSAGGVEYAMESEQWHNGLFTYCLLHGIQDQSADLDQDGTIMLSELQQYVREEVQKLSSGKQIPTSRMENLYLDYPIWQK